MEADGEEAERGGRAQDARSVVLQIAPQATCKRLMHAETTTPSLDLPFNFKKIKIIIKTKAQTQIRTGKNSDNRLALNAGSSLA